MMENVFSNYERFAEPGIVDRFMKHAKLVELLSKAPNVFSTEIVGRSEEGRTINLLRCGNGPVKVMVWSQMHGDEATGTMAILDFLRFVAMDINAELIVQILKECTLYFIPMVNPDGAERFSRRNVQQIDINRDYLKQTSAEAKLLASLQDQIKPEFGFNLHDQSTLWSVQGTSKPATLSYLAPAYSADLAINSVRERAMLVIADVFATLDPLLPGQIGLFKDEFEGRAFGDNFQLKGTSTILIEAGGMEGDPEKQELRKYYFLSLLSGLKSIASCSYSRQSLREYQKIPRNSKEIFHLLIVDVQVAGFITSVGINYLEDPIDGASGTERKYIVADIGDLRNWSAYQIIDSPGLEIAAVPLFESTADFDLLQGEQTILSFRNGILHSKQ
jgi:hypothetical protein